MPRSPTRHRVALVIALVGVAVSAFTLHVSRSILADAGYTSFCNLGGVVNCDAVLSSRWGTFADVPVSVWAIGVFVLGGLLALPGALGGKDGGFADLLLIGLASGSLGFALVLLGVAAFVLKHACLLCLTLDTIIIAWFIAVAPLASRFSSSTRMPWLQRRSAAYAATIAGLLVAVAAGAVEAVRQPATATTVAEVKAVDAKFFDVYTKLPVVPAADVVGSMQHVKGAATAPVTIVEFSDFQCPACQHAFGDLRTLVRSRSDVRLVFRHFPLDAACNAQMQQSMHPNACLAAAASECAALQGKFWEYHDVLFENQRALDRDSLFRYARDLGLEIGAFRTCLDDPATMDRVRADIESGNRMGVDSTPTIFINGRRVDGALSQPYYDFALVIEREQARDHAPQGGS
ncbi:MAG TPA: thioredoxin domain-containing protein [Candidatus Binatia bacterium]|jgi:protein-disulfide isomerase|nr:thioredoxin domain-containing protein [Candidatus Binatia bacterium]